MMTDQRHNACQSRRGLHAGESGMAPDFGMGSRSFIGTEYNKGQHVTSVHFPQMPNAPTPGMFDCVRRAVHVQMGSPYKAKWLTKGTPISSRSA